MYTSDKYPKWLLFLRGEIKLFQKNSVPRWMVFLFDILAVFLTFLLAYLLRFNFIITEIRLEHAISHGLIVFFIFACFFLIFRSYSGLIRHTTLTDVSLIFAANSASAATLFLFSQFSRIFKWDEILIIPFSIILIHYGLITVFLFLVRLSIKIVFRFVTDSLKTRKNVLIYGAGELGFIVKRVLLSDPQNEFNVKGFLDENKMLQGKKINGIPVYNPNVITNYFLQRNNIKILLLAIRHLSPVRKSEIIRSVIDFGLEILQTPSIDKWLKGHLEVRQLQKVKLEDLLGRDLNKPDMELIGRDLNEKSILVTGAAGSIGSEIVRQLNRFNPGKVILVDQAETPMFQIENELRIKNLNQQFHFLIGDVTNTAKMESIFFDYQPDIVFHTAAYKHVPLMEENPHEAFRVNIGGTKLIAELSTKYGVKKFVLISTDKCIKPTGVMGASKRICEKILQAASRHPGGRTHFVITRFGNVLGSNGSVVTIFGKQIADGGPVTVTHPDISRYFMTIPEACELVLEAGSTGKSGGIYVFDMGDPVKITDMASKMIRLSGLEPGKDIEIVYSGLRPGEKLTEELLNQNEITFPTKNPKIKIAQIENLDNPGLLPEIDTVLDNLYSFSKKEIIDIMQQMVISGER